MIQTIPVQRTQTRPQSSRRWRWLILGVAPTWLGIGRGVGYDDECTLHGGMRGQVLVPEASA